MPQNLVGLLFGMGCPDRGNVLFIEILLKSLQIMQFKKYNPEDYTKALPSFHPYLYASVYLVLYNVTTHLNSWMSFNR